MGARLNLTEAVLTRAHNLCIDQNGNIQVRSRWFFLDADEVSLY